MIEHLADDDIFPNNVDRIFIILMGACIIGAFLIALDGYHQDREQEWLLQQELKNYKYKISSEINNSVGMPYTMRLIVSNGYGTNNATHIYCNGKCMDNFSDMKFVLDGKTTIKPVWTDDTMWVTIPEGIHIAEIYYSNETIIPKKVFGKSDKIVGLRGERKLPALAVGEVQFFDNA